MTLSVYRIVVLTPHTTTALTTLPLASDDSAIASLYQVHDSRLLAECIILNLLSKLFNHVIYDFILYCYNKLYIVILYYI